MNNELYIARREKLYRELSDGILFDIRKINWDPSYKTLEKFCKETHCSIVKRYKELKKTKEFMSIGNILYAIDRLENIDLAFVVISGFVRRGSVATHRLGQGLEELLKKRKTNSGPFNFKLLIVGYKGINEGGGWDDGEPLLILDKIVNF